LSRGPERCLRAAHQMKEHGTFIFSEDAVKYAGINAMFA
jgi:hypothetical protein